MSERGPSKGRGTRVSGSVIAGLLLVPLTAVAAVAIVGATSRPPAAQAAEESTTTTEMESTTTTLVDVDSLTDAEALAQACTTSAQNLIEREMDESISELEIAALDALRTICDEHGMPIAGPPEPEAIVQVVTVNEAPQDGTTDDQSGTHDDDYEDDDYDDDHDHDDDDDDDHDEDEEDDEDEDDEEDDE